MGSNLAFSITFGIKCMDLTLFYSLCQPIPGDSQSDSFCLNFYTSLPTFGFPEIRLATLATIAEYLKQTHVSPNQHFVKRLDKWQAAVVIPHIIQGSVVQIVCRAVHEKSFQLLHSGISFPFGIGSFRPESRYLDPIICVEGVLDLYALRFVLPQANVVAALSAGMSRLQFDILCGLGHNFILAYDNDEAGRKACYTERKKLQTLGKHVVLLNHPSSFKDPGDLFKFLSDPFQSNIYTQHYKNQYRIFCQQCFY